MANHPKKKKNVRRAMAEEIELHPDAWERFERGMKDIVKVPSKLEKSGPNRPSEKRSKKGFKKNT